jgi:hypothetical protein
VVPATGNVAFVWKLSFIDGKLRGAPATTPARPPESLPARVPHMRRLLFFILLATAILTASDAQTPVPLTGEQRSWVAKAERHGKNGWIYLHIEGAPRERGFQHGYLLARDIGEAIRMERRYWEYTSAMDWPWLVGNAARMTTPMVDSEVVAEIDGIVEGMKAAGVGTTRDELVTYNAAAELEAYWWPTVKDSGSRASSSEKKQSCSSFIATGSMTSDGGIVLGHNTWTGYEGVSCNVIMDVLPERGHRILMQAHPGYVHSGTDFFITDAGIVGSETTIDEFFPFDPKGVPEFSRMRRASQYASSIDEWAEIMKKGNNGGYANAWLLGDITTNEIAWFELGLKHVGFEKKKDGYFSGSNVAEDLKILRFETKARGLNIKDADIARRVRWKQLMKQYAGRIDLERGKAFLADHYDTYLRAEIPGSRTICGHFEIDPETSGTAEPFQPLGACDGKVVDSRMAKNMSFLARWGSACGMPFDARKYLEEHPQYDWMEGILKDRPSQAWTEFKAGER